MVICATMLVTANMNSPAKMFLTFHHHVDSALQDNRYVTEQIVLAAALAAVHSQLAKHFFASLWLLLL